MKWSDLPTGHMAGGLYSPHPAAAIRLSHPVAGLGLAVSGAACLKLRVRPTHYHYHYHYHLHPHLLTRRYSLRHLTRHLHIAVECRCRDMRAAQPQVVDGVRPCVGKMQVVNRYPWMLAVFDTQQSPSTTTAAPCCCLGTPRGWLVSRTKQYSKLLRQHRQWCLPTGLVRDRY